jgi:tetratricopeptide (TPR) repeat protein
MQQSLQKHTRFVDSLHIPEYEKQDFILGKESEVVEKISVIKKTDRKLAIHAGLAYMELHPEAGSVLYELGKCYRAEKNLTLAERCFERVRELNPEHVKAICALGNLAVEKGDTGKARSFFEQAENLNPHDPVVPFALGQLALKEYRMNLRFGNPEELKRRLATVRDYFEKALKLSDDKVEIGRHLGEVAYFEGKPEVARGYFEAHLKVYPSSIVSSKFIAIIACDEDRLEDALPHVQKLGEKIKHDRSLRDALHRYATRATYRQDFAKAKLAYAAALHIAAGDEHILRKLRALE